MQGGFRGWKEKSFRLDRLNGLNGYSKRQITLWSDHSNLHKESLLDSDPHSDYHS